MVAGKRSHWKVDRAKCARRRYTGSVRRCRFEYVHCRTEGDGLQLRMAGHLHTVHGEERKQYGVKFMLGYGSTVRSGQESKALSTLPYVPTSPSTRCAGCSVHAAVEA